MDIFILFVLFILIISDMDFYSLLFIIDFKLIINFNNFFRVAMKQYLICCLRGLLILFSQDFIYLIGGFIYLALLSLF